MLGVSCAARGLWKLSSVMTGSTHVSGDSACKSCSTKNVSRNEKNSGHTSTTCLKRPERRGTEDERRNHQTVDVELSVNVK